jgi:hypothetical protein
MRIRAIRDGKAGNLASREEAAAHWRQVLDREAYIATINEIAGGNDEHARTEQSLEIGDVGVPAPGEPAGSAV